MPAWVQTDATNLLIIDWDIETNVADMQSGGRVRIRGIDRDPWLKYDNSSPYVYGVRGDPGIGSVFSLVVDGAATMESITTDHRFVICLVDPLRPLGVSDGRLTPVADFADATRFRFEVAVVPPEMTEEAYCVKVYYYDRPPVAETVLGSRDQAYQRMEELKAQGAAAESRINEGAC